MLIGTDYPYPRGEHPAGAVIRAATVPAERQAMLAGYARTYLGLP